MQHACSAALEANSYTSLHPQHASRVPELHTSTPLRHLHSFVPGHQRASAPITSTSTSARLQRTPRPPYLHVPTPATHIQSSRAPHLFASTSARPQRMSRAPYLSTSTSPSPQHGAGGTQSLATSHDFFD